MNIARNMQLGTDKEVMEKAELGATMGPGGGARVVQANRFDKTQHMGDGVVVRFSNGSEGVLRKTLRGWMLIADDGRQVIRPVPCDASLTARVRALEADSADT